jgi:Fur family ferric uptake transcriptional regulator
MKETKEIEIIERYMRDRGYRWTAQRRLIAEVAFGTHEHFNAEELLEMCRKVDNQVSRATVYRTLSMLEGAGFIESLETGDGGRKFEHVLGHEHHDHMVCAECGRIVEFRDRELEARKKQIASEHGFDLLTHSLKLVVGCRDPNCEGKQHGGQEVH